MERLSQVLTGIFVALIVLCTILLLAILEKQIEIAKSIASIDTVLSQLELVE